MESAMNQSLSSALRYSLVCLILLGLSQLSPLHYADRFYQFDRAHVFVPTFYLALLFIGVIVRPYDTATWARAQAKGAIVGAAAGLIAYLVTILVNRHGLNFFSMSTIIAATLSALFTIIVFLTPVWGIVSALTARLLMKKADIR
jgi:hypothetical protein